MNDITDVNGFIEKMTQQGYNVEKYGNTPVDLTPEIKEVEKIVEVEVIKEVVNTVEVEVEKIVEVIKEIPVDVIKEVIVEKEVYVTNDEVNKGLQNNITKLEEEIIRLTKLVESHKRNESVHYKSLKTVVGEKNVLQDKFLELEKELEEEKKKPKRVKSEIKAPESMNRKSSINWVSKDDRNNDNLYDD
jgi:hypothetical protein